MQEPSTPTPSDIDRGPRHQFICLNIGKEYYAIPIEQIKEIVLPPPITPVPLTRTFVLGVTNIRGNIVPIIRLEQLFGIPETQQNSNRQFIVVVEGIDYLLGLLVDQLPETLHVYESEIDSSGHVIQHENSDQSYIRGVIHKNQQMIALLDCHQMVEINLRNRMNIA